MKAKVPDRIGTDGTIWKCTPQGNWYSCLGQVSFFEPSWLQYVAGWYYWHPSKLGEPDGGPFKTASEAISFATKFCHIPSIQEKIIIELKLINHSLDRLEHFLRRT